MPVQLAKVASNDLLLLERTSWLVTSCTEYSTPLLISDLVWVSLFIPVLARLAKLREWSELVCVNKFAIAASGDYDGRDDGSARILATLSAYAGRHRRCIRADAYCL